MNVVSCGKYKDNLFFEITFVYYEVTENASIPKYHAAKEYTCSHIFHIRKYVPRQKILSYQMKSVTSQVRGNSQPCRKFLSIPAPVICHLLLLIRHFSYINLSVSAVILGHHVSSITGSGFVVDVFWGSNSQICPHALCVGSHDSI